MLLILGGGPAGLASAFYAAKRKEPFCLFEAGKMTGGNCRTLKHGEFYFDTGAHRFHDKIPDITKDVQEILADKLIKINVPSQIYSNGKFIDFPLSPFNLLKSLDIKTIWNVILEKIQSHKPSGSDFESFAIRQFGPSLAHLFLLEYSEKLWGEPCRNLSTDISGKRLKGLDLKTFLFETFFGKRLKTRHLDGDFYYPEEGIGMLFEQIETGLHSSSVKKDSRVTKIIHNKGKIKSIIINNENEFYGDQFINTLPLSHIIQLLDPKPDEILIDYAKNLKFRQLRLALICLNKSSFSKNASLYFPRKEDPFTRIYEPKNRSNYMSPKENTAILLELPCKKSDDIYQMEDEALKKILVNSLSSKKLIREDDVIDFKSYILENAYPVLNLNFQNYIKPLSEYLNSFENMHYVGRNALFQYTHIHDIFSQAKQIIKSF